MAKSLKIKRKPLTFSTIENAPELETLFDLLTGWHHVCTHVGTDRLWVGILDRDPRVFAAYRRGVEEGRIITLQRRLGDAHFRVYAKVAAGQSLEPIKPPASAQVFQRW